MAIEGLINSEEKKNWKEDIPVASCFAYKIIIRKIEKIKLFEHQFDIKIIVNRESI